MLRYGQRRTFIALLALVFEASALLVVVPATADHEWLRHVLLKVFARAVTAAATSANYLYTAEAFPTAVRSTGLTVSYASGRVGAVFATALMSVQATHMMPLMNIAMMLLALGASVAVHMVPESMAEAKESDAGVTGAHAISSHASRGCEEIAAILKDPSTPWDTAHKSTAPLTRTRLRASTHLHRGFSKNESVDSVSHGIPSCDEAIVKSHDEPKY
ncbi:hypothetical protein HPB51_001557 [Rhipicephalus microplus]|uniref:Major facilitator superfamily (MFS) profile domain-containing protein n=1 Tax=Rhipicephalus microplus TaxID=6941 RepID=A0A9J6EVS6_RHIMP|nr:hypothetical protein HPB51_001557 [Rhipicephalus microplus]